METIIRLRLSELSVATIEKLRTILRSTSDNSDPEIAIVLDDSLERNKGFYKKLDASIDQLKNGNTVSFTMEEFTNYINANFKK